MSKDDFCPVNQLRTTQIERLLEKGLEIRPLQSDEIWDCIWQRFNKSGSIPVPQRIVLDDEGISKLVTGGNAGSC